MERRKKDLNSVESVSDKRKLVLLDNIYGQEEVVERLKQIVKRSKDNKTRVSNMALVGYDINQAQRLSLALANELGTVNRVAHEYDVSKPGNFADFINRLEERNVVFLDWRKIHNNVREMLFTVISGDYIDILLGKDSTARSVRLELPSCIYVIYCNDFDEIPQDLAEYIPEVFNLHELSEEEKKRAIIKYCAINELRIDDECVAQLGSFFRSWVQLEKYLDYLLLYVIGKNGIILPGVLTDTKEYAARLNRKSNVLSDSHMEQEMLVTVKDVQKFTELLSKAGGPLQATIFRSLLKDYFYNNTLHANLLYLAFDMGIESLIAHEAKIDKAFMEKAAKRLSQDYGIKTNASIWAITMWVKSYH